MRKDQAEEDSKSHLSPSHFGVHVQTRGWLTPPYRPNPARSLFLYVRFYWDTVMPIQSKDCPWLVLCSNSRVGESLHSQCGGINTGRLRPCLQEVVRPCPLPHPFSQQSLTPLRDKVLWPWSRRKDREINHRNPSTLGDGGIRRWPRMLHRFHWKSSTPRRKA